MVSLYDKESLSQEVSCSSIAASSEAESSDVPTVPVENIENDRHHNRTKLKQKEQQPIDFNLLTRRSARRIPGFSLPEDDFFTRYQRPPLPVKEQLLNCFPPAISDQLKSYDSSSGSQVSPVRTEKSLTAIKADRKICHNLEEERRIVEEYLSINDGKCLSDLMCNWLLVVEKTRWHQGWNAEGLVVFLKCYACWKEMVDGWIFDEFSPEHVASNSDLLALLFCEIYFKLKTSGSVDSAVRGLSDLYDKTLGHLNFGFGPMNAAKSLAVRGNQDFFSRLQWLLANVSLVDGKFITGANFARMLVENQTNFRYFEFPQFLSENFVVICFLGHLSWFLIIK